jgi:hypothetical protein
MGSELLWTVHYTPTMAVNPPPRAADFLSQPSYFFFPAQFAGGGS